MIINKKIISSAVSTSDKLDFIVNLSLDWKSGRLNLSTLIRHSAFLKKIAEQLLEKDTYAMALNLLLAIERKVVSEAKKYKLQNINPPGEFVRLKDYVDTILSEQENFHRITGSIIAYLKEFNWAGDPNKYLLDYVTSLRLVNPGVPVANDVAFKDKIVLGYFLGGMPRGLLFMHFCNELGGFDNLLDSQLPEVNRIAPEKAEKVIFYEISISEFLSKLRRSEMFFAKAFEFIKKKYPQIKEILTYSPVPIFPKYMLNILQRNKAADHYQLSRERLLGLIRSKITDQDERLLIRKYQDSEIETIVKEYGEFSREGYPEKELGVCLAGIISSGRYLQDAEYITIFYKFVEPLMEIIVRERRMNNKDPEKAGSFLDPVVNLHMSMGAEPLSFYKAKIFKTVGLKVNYIYSVDNKAKNVEEYWTRMRSVRSLIF